ncbi:PEPxxWA-CTERM sorting domain-containing protein [Bradyrhizobium sp. 170]|uniref:PEPxxWA-CTERM sorting domain-containing protein n=1 Tax=Bradyrhizobium sp. 170 TaxID=2782641 RepID=UPI001FFE837B|nr:PEPxxWA-CTERM sorting domain-containing protein [Bradyrhizobium sp. 170]UPK00427.1 PEP-CTERM sorting domain-containing protein [Bradyrhizobium sp. 170]
MKSRLLGALAGAALCSIASQASATIVNVTYQGIVTYDRDLTGVFGTVGGSNDLVGQSYTAKFTFDTSLGTSTSNPGPYADQRVYGGTGYGTTSPVISSTVTIGSVTVSVPATYIGTAATQYNTDGSGFGQQTHLARYNNSANNIYADLSSQAYVYAYDGSVPFSLTGPFTYTPTYVGYLSFNDYVYDRNLGQVIQDTYVQANVTSLTVTTGVPEPSTWAMIILGFAGVGFAAYRRGSNSVRWV